MTNIRRTLAIKVQTPGGDNPLQMRLVGAPSYYRGITVSGLALVGKGGTAPYAFSILSGGDSSGGVNGLTLHADGTFSGSGDEAGRFVFVAQVSDSAGAVFAHSFSLTFLPQLMVVRGTPTPGENLLHYNFQFVVRNLSGTTITSGYSVSEGSTPIGLTLHANGIYDGDPDFASIGTNYFTVRVTNGSDSIDIPVAHVIYPPFLVFGIEEKAYFYVGIPQSAPGNATEGPTGGLKPYRYRWDNLADYPWLTYDPQANVFSGTPSFDNIGIEQTITGSVSDALGAEIPVTFKFTPVFAQAGIDIGSGNKINALPETGYVVLGSSDGSVIIESDTSGGIDLRTTGGPSPPSSGGVDTVNGVGPDSSGDLHIDGIGVDSNGDLFVEGGGGSGTVTSVALALPSDIFAVSGSPVTGSGTLTGTKQTQTANTVFAGPTTGSAAQPAFRALVPADLPFGIDYLKVFDPRTQFYDYSEMLVTPTNNLEGWTTGFGNTAVLTSVVGTRGLWRVSLNTGLGGVAGGLNYVLGGGGATRNYFRFRIPTLSISTSRFTVDIGWRDNITGALNDGLLVRYSDNVNSGALQLISTVATVASSANGITALVANTWYDGYIDVNTGGTQAVLVLNGVTECTLSASLSSTAVRKALLLSGTSGVGHVIDFDYMHIVGTR